MKNGGKSNRIVQNNIYILKLVWSICKSRVFHTALCKFLFYLEWIFYSGFFIRFVINSAEEKQSFQKIAVFLFITIIIFCLLSIYNNYFENRVTPLTDTVIYKGLYKKLYQKAANIEIGCFENNDFYNQYTMALESANDKVIAAINNLSSIGLGGIAAAISFYIMYEIDHYAILFVISPIVGNFVFGSILNKLTYRMTKDQTIYNRKAEYINRVIHLSDYAKEVRLTNVFKLMMEKYSKAIQGKTSVVSKYSVKAIFADWFHQMFTYTIIFESVLLYGAYRTMVTKSMQLSEFAVLSSFMVATTWILIGFSTSLVECYKNNFFIENLRIFLEYTPVIPEDYDGVLPDPEITSIEFRNVSFGYEKDNLTVKNLSFAIKGKNSAAFVGHNGAGKSTLIKLIFRFYDPTEGAIYVNGRDIREYNLKAYRRLFSAAFQDYKIFAMSIKENVLMRRATAADDIIVENALIKAGVYDKVTTLQNGMDTVLTREFDEEGAVLSGGEYQKIVMARTFANDAQIKIFDEPSSALDPIAEYELFDSILKDSKDKTMIFVSHRLSSVQNADAVFLLEHGEIIERGTHKSLMELGRVYADLYRKQAEDYLAAENYDDVINIGNEYAGSIFAENTVNQEVSL